MNNVKYLGIDGLERLIDLTQNELAARQTWIQFPDMPPAEKSPGKVVQYTGITNNKYTKGYFYQSNGSSWQQVSVTSAIVFCKDRLPSWVLAEPGVIYFVATENATYLKDNETEGHWFNLTEGKEAGSTFKVVNKLPTWLEASDKIIYLLIKDNTNYVIGYIKSEETGKYLCLGGSGGTVNYNELENTPTINGISTVNKENPSKPKNVELNVLHKGYKGVEYDEDGENIPVNELELMALNDSRIIEMFEDN